MQTPRCPSLGYGDLDESDELSATLRPTGSVTASIIGNDLPSPHHSHLGMTWPRPSCSMGPISMLGRGPAAIQPGRGAPDRHQGSPKNRTLTAIRIGVPIRVLLDRY